MSVKRAVLIALIGQALAFGVSIYWMIGETYSPFLATFSMLADYGGLLVFFSVVYARQRPDPEAVE